MVYKFHTKDVGGDTFTQLLGINDAETIVGYHGATVNKGEVTAVHGGFTSDNFPGSAQTQVTGVSNLGEQVGFYVDNNGVTHGFVQQGTIYTTADAPNTAFNQLLGVNDEGVAVGYSSSDPTGLTLQKAYVRDANGTVNYIDFSKQHLSPSANTQATGITDNGEVVGFIQTGTTSVGFVDINGAISEVKAFGSSFTQILGVNNEGEMVGDFVDSAGNMHGFTDINGQFTQIDAPGASATTVNGVNDFGQLVGFDTVGTVTNGFVATNDPYSYKTIDFSPDPTHFTQLLGINDSGVIAGYYGQAVNQGFTISSTGTFTSENFPTSTQTQVVGINSLGETVGFYVDNTTAAHTHGFIDNNGVFTSVDAAGTSFNQLLGVNDRGQTVGYSSTDPAGMTLQQAFERDPNGSINYVTLPSNVNSQATGINDSGEIVGFLMPTASTSVGFIDNGGKVTELSVPGSTFTQILGVNNEGEMVGDFVDSNGVMHGFTYQNGQFGVVDVPGATSTTVNGINDFGQLAGFYVDSQGHTDGFTASYNHNVTLSGLSSGAIVTVPGGFGGASVVVNGHSNVTLVDSSVGTVTIEGNSGNDTFISQKTGDSLIGGSGNNTFQVIGYDTITTGAGSNTITMSGTANEVFANGTDVINASVGLNTIYTGANAMVFLHGTGNMNVVAGPGYQTVDASGTSRNVSIQATNGKDTLIAGSGNDILVGGSGNDLFVGGAHGHAAVTAGSGFDLFQINDGSATHMTISDFATGKDHIHLSGFSSTEQGYDLAHQSLNGAGTAFVNFSDHSQVAIVGLGRAVTASDFG